MIAADTTFTVRPFGGDFSSVQAALDSAARDPAQTGHLTLDILGTFRERVVVHANLTEGVLVVGSGARPLDAMVIHNTSGNAGGGTFNSYTMRLDAPNVTLMNIVVANDANNYNRHIAGQSVALHLNGGTPAVPQRVRVLNSSLLGAQDTLYTGSVTSLSYYYNTYINGSVDALFGESSSVFENCVLEHTDTLTAHKGTQLASGATTHWATGPGDVTAYLLINCNVTLGW